MRTIISRDSISIHRSNVDSPRESAIYRARRPLAALAGITAAVSHWPFRRLDLDLHHDGYMAAVAVAVSEGRAPHADVFTQYGPLIAYLQGFWLRLTGVSVLNLRTLHILLFACTAALLALSGRSRARSPWPVHPASGPIAAFAWIALSDTFTGVPILPWVSMLVALTMFTALNLIRLSKEVSLPRASRALEVFAGLLSATIALSRPSLFVALSLGIAVVLIDSRFRAIYARFAIGHAIGALFIAGGVGLSPFRSEFITDMLYWPFLAYAEGGSLQMSLRVLTRTGFFLLPQICTALLVVLRLRSTLTQRDFSWALSLVAVLALQQLDHIWWQISLLLGLALVLAIESRLFTRTIAALRRTSALVLLGLVFVAIPFIGQTWPGWHAVVGNRTPVAVVLVTALYTAAYAAGLVALAHIVAAIFKRDEMKHEQDGVLLSLFVLTGLGEAAAAPDTRHIWWGLPIGLLLLTHYSLCRQPSYMRIGRSAFGLAALSAVAVIVHVSMAYLSEPRIMLTEGIGRGMKVSQALADEYGSQHELVGLLFAGEEAHFSVTDALITVVGGSYLPRDRHIVSWGPGGDDVSLLEPPAIVEAASYQQGSTQTTESLTILSGTGGHYLILRRSVP